MNEREQLPAEVTAQLPYDEELVQLSFFKLRDLPEQAEPKLEDAVTGVDGWTAGLGENEIVPGEYTQEGSVLETVKV